ncbi:AzlC family ABC transporter permease [Clostridium neuense]|uniref:AzlC family ABC transporter permease n=1 Tax=Clostridium neuense TaxID=1728934 RepID=A0ABW8TCY3_9CLOT
MLEEQRIHVNSNEFLKGVKDCIPTLFGYLSIGFACGVVSKSCGMTVLETVAMSTFIYAGSAQFIAASMILSSASITQTILTVFLVNLRHLLMSAAIAPYFKDNSLKKNFTVGMLMTDETFALASSEGNNKSNISYKWMIGVNVTAYLNWIAATFVGACFSSLIYDYKKFGLDFALPAMFIGLLVSSLKDNSEVKKSAIVVAFSAIIFIVAVKFFSANTAIVISAVLGAFIGGVVKK